jgi:hypothetical protein
MAKFDLIGKRVGNYVVQWLGRDEDDGSLWWNCLCDCGNEFPLKRSDILYGAAQNCGCKQLPRARVSSGKKYPNDKYISIGKPTAELRTYNGAKSRCTQLDNSCYGGRGIQFRFNSFEEFLTEIGKRPSSLHSIDRIDNDGHYEKGNVRWATTKEQAANRRTEERAVLDGFDLDGERCRKIFN